MSNTVGFINHIITNLLDSNISDEDFTKNIKATVEIYKIDIGKDSIYWKYITDYKDKEIEFKEDCLDIVIKMSNIILEKYSE